MKQFGLPTWLLPGFTVYPTSTAVKHTQPARLTTDLPFTERKLFVLEYYHEAFLKGMLVILNTAYVRYVKEDDGSS